eukprot:CAMPEP_0168796876 /NCGR_PEP_ID=MMETSP0725-20121227/17004_1 /TAXON_ID=265536 /ORGANISM="Amphiprora sp., Strain CCMP467" /LENGTH=1566 /DNA_ID=CAMNT_0008848051 /DNA_START=197 /DNA_END=4897 /DNA_ORIENTATION=+
MATAMTAPPMSHADLSMAASQMAQERQDRLAAGGEQRMTKVEIKEKEEYKLDFKTICLEAAELGRLTRLNEHIIEAVATEKTPEQEWASQGLLAMMETSRLQQQHRLVIQEAARKGRQTKLEEQVTMKKQRQAKKKYSSLQVYEEERKQRELLNQVGAAHLKLDHVISKNKKDYTNDDDDDDDEWEDVDDENKVVHPKIYYESLIRNGNIEEMLNELPRPDLPQKFGKKSQAETTTTNGTNSNASTQSTDSTSSSSTNTKSNRQQPQHQKEEKTIHAMVAQRARARTSRLNWPGSVPRMKEEGCQCPWCQKSSPFQTLAYKKKKQWEEQLEREKQEAERRRIEHERREQERLEQERLALERQLEEEKDMYGYGDQNTHGHLAYGGSGDMSMHDSWTDAGSTDGTTPTSERKHKRGFFGRNKQQRQGGGGGGRRGSILAVFGRKKSSRSTRNLGGGSNDDDSISLASQMSHSFSHNVSSRSIQQQPSSPANTRKPRRNRRGSLLGMFSARSKMEKAVTIAEEPPKPPEPAPRKAPRHGRRGSLMGVLGFAAKPKTKTAMVGSKSDSLADALTTAVIARSERVMDYAENPEQYKTQYGDAPESEEPDYGYGSAAPDSAAAIPEGNEEEEEDDDDGGGGMLAFVKQAHRTSPVRSPGSRQSFKFGENTGGFASRPPLSPSGEDDDDGGMLAVLNKAKSNKDMNTGNDDDDGGMLAVLNRANSNKDISGTVDDDDDGGMLAVLNKANSTNKAKNGPNSNSIMSFSMQNASSDDDSDNMLAFVNKKKSQTNASESEDFGYGDGAPDSAMGDYGYGDGAPDSAIGDYGYGDGAPDSAMGDYGYGDGSPDSDNMLAFVDKNEDFGYGDGAPDSAFVFDDTPGADQLGYGDAAPDSAQKPPEPSEDGAKRKNFKKKKGGWLSKSSRRNKKRLSVSKDGDGANEKPRRNNRRGSILALFSKAPSPSHKEDPSAVKTEEGTSAAAVDKSTAKGRKRRGSIMAAMGFGQQSNEQPPAQQQAPPQPLFRANFPSSNTRTAPAAPPAPATKTVEKRRRGSLLASMGWSRKPAEEGPHQQQAQTAPLPDISVPTAIETSVSTSQSASPPPLYRPKPPEPIKRRTNIRDAAKKMGQQKAMKAKEEEEKAKMAEADAKEKENTEVEKTSSEQSEPEEKDSAKSESKKSIAKSKLSRAKSADAAETMKSKKKSSGKKSKRKSMTDLKEDGGKAPKSMEKSSHSKKSVKKKKKTRKSLSHLTLSDDKTAPPQSDTEKKSSNDSGKLKKQISDSHLESSMRTEEALFIEETVTTSDKAENAAGNANSTGDDDDADGQNDTVGEDEGENSQDASENSTESEDNVKPAEDDKSLEPEEAPAVTSTPSGDTSAAAESEAKETETTDNDVETEQDLDDKETPSVETNEVTGDIAEEKKADEDGAVGKSTTFSGEDKVIESDDEEWEDTDTPLPGTLGDALSSVPQEGDLAKPKTARRVKSDATHKRSKKKKKGSSSDDKSVMSTSTMESSKSRESVRSSKSRKSHKKSSTRNRRSSLESGSNEKEATTISHADKRDRRRSCPDLAPGKT